MSLKEKKLLSDIAEKSNEVKTIWDKAGDDDLDAATKQRVITLNKEIEEKELEVKEIREQREMRAANEVRQQEISRADPDLKTPRQSAVGQPQTIGEQFTGSEAFAAWFKAAAPGGRIPERARVQTPGVQVKTLLTGVSSTSAGALVVNERLNIIDPGTFRRPLTVLSLITRGTTGSDTVEYVREGTHTNNAATVAEATATSGNTGAKPESAMALSIITEVVKTLAHWIPATRRALADVSQLRSLIDSFLRYGLEEELEDQILNGDGVGENFTGIYNTSGTTTQAWDTNVLTTTRKARTKVMTTGRGTPSAYLMHPNDWQTIDLLQDNEARYFFGGPSATGTPRLWGLPVVESEVNTEGYALVADWRLAMLWDREQAQILVSDSHSDFFTRNLLAILAEMRAAFGVVRPAAFVEIDMTA